MIDANDTLIMPAPEGTTAVLRSLDARIAALQSAQNVILGDHIESQGWSTETHNINFDLQSGMFTVTPKLAQAA